MGAIAISNTRAHLYMRIEASPKYLQENRARVHDWLLYE